MIQGEAKKSFWISANRYREFSAFDNSIRQVLGSQRQENQHFHGLQSRDLEGIEECYILETLVV